MRERMVRQNLAEFFWDYFVFPAEYLVYDDGCRRWTYSYGEVAESALAFATGASGPSQASLTDRGPAAGHVSCD